VAPDPEPGRRTSRRRDPGQTGRLASGEAHDHHGAGPGAVPAGGRGVRTVVFDIDTQHDFMDPTGLLYVPGAESIVPLVRRLLAAARAHHVPVVASMDAHTPDDPEFAHFAPHCVAGTPGQAKIPETALGPFRLVPNAPLTLRGLDREPFLRVEKQTFSLLSNVNLGQILDQLRPERCVVLGVATEFCVRATALGLRARCNEVAVVTDAVCAVDAAAGARALAELRAAGVRTIDTAQALAWIGHRECDDPEGAPGK
jgi:nicotinamidase/pyrazinamidase